MKIKPFIRWAGGKQGMVDSLLKHAPHDSLINNYFEPFLGAGSLYFANGFEDAVISDINPQLINSYQAIKDGYLDVYKYLKTFEDNFLKDPSFYYTVREHFNAKRTQHNSEQAAMFIFLIHTNYNGMYRLNRNGYYNVPVGKLKPAIPSLQQLQLISNKLKRAQIHCSDYVNIHSQVKKNDFIFLDPPYPPLDWENPQNQYTVNGFSKEDHDKLLAFCVELDSKGCLLMITYPDIPFIRKLYAGWNFVELDTFRSISCKKQRKRVSELVIKNY